eukprot:4078617-Pleurochrysis_carterae.AAC.1
MAFLLEYHDPMRSLVADVRDFLYMRYSVYCDPSCAPQLHLEPVCFGAKHLDLEFSASTSRSGVPFGASSF